LSVFTRHPISETPQYGVVLISVLVEDDELSAPFRSFLGGNLKNIAPFETRRRPVRPPWHACCAACIVVSIAAISSSSIGALRGAGRGQHDAVGLALGAAQFAPDRPPLLHCSGTAGRVP
jgi:hypothetical protein